MSYGGFLALWLLPPLLTLFVAIAYKPFPSLPRFYPRSFSLLWAFLVTVALLYTTPWDNYLVAKRIWTYPAERVWGIRLGWVPLEEYLFFVLQTTLTALWLEGLVRWKGAKWLSARDNPLVWSVVGVGFVLMGLTAWGIFLGKEWTRGTYWVLISGWALPVIGGQLILARKVIGYYRRYVVVGIAVPTFYLWVADTWAIREGIWHITEATSLGVALPGGLPIEEALFFAVTNVMVAGGWLLVRTFPPRAA